MDGFLVDRNIRAILMALISFYYSLKMGSSIPAKDFSDRGSGKGCRLRGKRAVNPMVPNLF
jgi:hypothetical protein